MSNRAIGASYAHSFLWVVLFITLMFGSMTNAELVFLDIVHGNPNRTRDDVLSMMAWQTPIVGVIAATGNSRPHPFLTYPWRRFTAWARHSSI